MHLHETRCSRCATRGDRFPKPARGHPTDPVFIKEAAMPQGTFREREGNEISAEEPQMAERLGGLAWFFLFGCMLVAFLAVTNF